MPLQTANQFQLAPEISRLGSGFQQGQQIAEQFQLSGLRDEKAQQVRDEARKKSVFQAAVEINNLPTSYDKAKAVRDRMIELEKAGIDSSDTKEAYDLYNRGMVKEADAVIKAAADTAYQFGYATPPKVLTSLDVAKIENLNAEAEMFKGATDTKALDTLVSDASPEVQDKARSAYSLAGKADKGVKAVIDVLKTGVESERRLAAPETLKAAYPKADAEEMTALQAVVDSAKTTESGFKEAGKLRVKQRQVKKAKVFQVRAVELLDRILSADELNDVIGSMEGGYVPLRGDAESEVIADIEEAGNILTADNLDIMSGVLSETDIKIISNLAGGALNRKRGEESFVRDVTKLRNKMQKGIDQTKETDIDSLVKKYSGKPVYSGEVDRGE